jgi:hypothetical protein
MMRLRRALAPQVRRAGEAMWSFEVVSGRGRWRIKPAGYIHYPYAISVVFVMSKPCLSDLTHLIVQLSDKGGFFAPLSR